MGVVAVNGQTTGQAGVDMSVGVDEAGHDDSALGVHKFSIRVFGLQVGEGAHLLDHVAVQHHGAVSQIGQGAVPGNQFAVSHQKHGNSSF